MNQIMEECEKAKLPKPEYEIDPDGIKLIFRYGKGNHISTTYVPHKYHISTTQVKSLVSVVADKTLSVTEMMEALNLKNRSYFMKDYVKPALEQGLIEPVFPDQPRSPKQKYRLTEKGKSSLTQ